MNSNSKTILALLAGFAAGAVAGLLLAPEKGSDTRDRLSQSLKNLRDKVKDKMADEIDHLSTIKDQVVDNVKSKIHSVANDDLDGKAKA